MPAIYHEGSWLGNATDPEVLVKDTVGWTGKNRAYSQTNNAVIAHIENGITYDVSWTGSATVTLKKNSTSGATITSGSTSPLSFTADADYELYFGSSATVTNIMVKDSRITDPTYEPYHQAIQNQLNAQGVLGAKNLLPYPYAETTSTKNGITFTVNSDGTVTVNGTATAEALFTLHRYLTDIKLSGNFILNGCPTGGTNTTYQIYLQRRNAENTGWDNPIYRDFGDGVNVTIEDGRLFDVNILIRNGATLNNLVFKPMLRLASNPDDTYQPYAMTNRELTEKVDNLDMFKKDIRINQTTGETLSSMLDRMLAALISYIQSLNTNYYVFLESLSIPGYDTISPERLYIINPSSTWTASEIMFSRIRATASDIKINSVAMYTSSSNYYRGILKYDGSAGSVNNMGSNTGITNITLRMMVFKQYG